MGEGAEYLFDQMIDALCDSDYYDEEDWGGGSADNTRVCRYCKQRGLHWVETDRGWRMADRNDQIHNCCDKRREYLRTHPHPSHG